MYKYFIIVIAKHFMCLLLLWMVHFQITISNFSFIVCRNTIDICILIFILWLAKFTDLVLVFLKIFIILLLFFVDVLEFCLYTIIMSGGKKMVLPLFFFPHSVHLLCFALLHCLGPPVQRCVGVRRADRYLCLTSDLRRKAFDLLWLIWCQL